MDYKTYFAEHPGWHYGNFARMLAGIVGGNGHDGSGSVAHQDIIRDPDRDPVAVDRVDRVSAGEDAGFLLGVRGTVEVGLVAGFLNVLLDGRPLSVGGDQIDQLVFRGQNHVGGPEESVRPSGVDPNDLFVVGDLEVNLGAFAAPDPVLLHELDRLRPVDQVKVVLQPVGVGGDSQHPLAQRTAEDRVVAAFAASVVGHLLVGQYGAQCRAPVDRDLVEVGQPVLVEDGLPLLGGQFAPRAHARFGTEDGFGPPSAGFADLAVIADPQEVLLQLMDQLGDRAGRVDRRVVPAVVELEEDPLGPLVVGHVGSCDFAFPVVAKPEPLHL